MSVRGDIEGRQGVETEREGHRGGNREGGGWGSGGEEAPDVCNLFIEEQRKVISSDGGLGGGAGVLRREEKIENS